MASYEKYASSNVQFTFDLNKSTFFKRNDKNFINILSVAQLNTLENISLLDIFLSKGHVIEPHYHPNATELVYCIKGAASISLLNPFTKQLLTYRITPGEVVNIPRAWWHYEIALVDDTHLLAIFDAPTSEVILGSDLVTLTPSNIWAHTYCMDENEWKKAIRPVRGNTLIGPYAECNKERMDSYPNNWNPNFYYPAHYFSPYGWWM